MRVLVAGSTGFIGSALVARLRSGGASVTGASLALGVDVTDWNRVAPLDGFDAVVNVAGRTFVPSSREEPHLFFRDNFLVTLNLLELARRLGARYVHAGSYVYGAPRYLPVDERHPTGAHNPYAASKLHAERLCLDYARDFGVRVVVLRLFNVYGRGQREDFLIPKIVAGVRAGSLTLEDPAPRRDFVHVDDVVEAFARSLTWNGASSDVFNVGSGVSTSVEALAEIAVRAAAWPVDVRFIGRSRPSEIPDVVADIGKAAKVLDWRPRVDIEEGIASLVRATEGGD
jgi:nucleoside-diphosphate-sugar epimerase